MWFFGKPTDEFNLQINSLKVVAVGSNADLSKKFLKQKQERKKKRKRYK